MYTRQCAKYSAIDWNLIEMLEECHSRVIPILGVKPVDEESNTLKSRSKKLFFGEGDQLTLALTDTAFFKKMKKKN